jgi:hypothetical protein
LPLARQTVGIVGKGFDRVEGKSSGKDSRKRACAVRADAVQRELGDLLRSSS